MKDRLPDISRRMTGILLLLPFMVLFLMGKPFSQITFVVISVIMMFEFAFLISKNTWMRSVLISLISVFGMMSFFAIAPFYHLIILAGIILILFCFFSYQTVAIGLALSLLSYSVGLFSHHEFFQEIMLYIVVTIISVDIGAYLVGRFVGGPKLLPLVSPAKTISGAIGGLIGGMISGTIICYILSVEITAWLLLVTMLVAILAQIGDITESFFKRAINTKDSAKIIPGHGGFMDRFDGYLFVIPLFALSPVDRLFV